MSHNYYTILGVPSNATTKQIRERFLQLAREQHPDRYTAEEKEQAEAQFQLVTQAYNVLVDPDRRRQYDHEHAERSKSPSGAVSTQAARVYLKRGVEAYKKGNYTQAVDSFERATQENSEDAQAWYYLARALNHRSAWLSRALAAAAKSCELDSMNATYLKLAGELAAKAGMSTRAERYLQDALTFGGEDAEVQLALDQVRRMKSP
jgi:DnaJ-class molecular chaperone